MKAKSLKSLKVTRSKLFLELIHPNFAILDVTTTKPRKPFHRRLCNFFLATGTALLLILGSSSLFYADSESFVSLDPVLGLIGITVILSVIYPSLKESGLILLQTVPKHIEVSRLEKSLEKAFPEIIKIHDLHIWCLTRDKIIVTCHIDLPSMSTEAYKTLSDKIVNFFSLQGISMVTIQPEFREMTGSSSDKCLYTCSKEEGKCDRKTCCHVAADPGKEEIVV